MPTLLLPVVAVLAACWLVPAPAAATLLHGSTDARITLDGILQIEDPQADTFPQSAVDHDLDGAGWAYAGAVILDQGVFPPPATTSANLLLDQDDTRSLQARSFALVNQKFQIDDVLNPGRAGTVGVRVAFQVDFDIQFEGDGAFGQVQVNFARFNDVNQVLSVPASFTCAYGAGQSAGCSGSSNLDLSGLTVQEDAGHATFTGSIAALFSGEISDAFHAGIGFASQADLFGGLAGDRALVGKGNLLSFELSSPEEGVVVTALALPAPEPSAAVLLAAALAAAVACARRGRAAPR